MKKALIISRNWDNPGVSWLKNHLEEAAFRVELSTSPSVADLVINRSFGMDYDDSDLEAIKALSLRTLNSLRGQKICRDKYKTLKLGEKLSILTGEFFTLEDFLSRPRKGFWCLKTLRGMQGRGVSKALSWEQINFKMKTSHDRRYMVQSWIDGEEFRVFCLGKELSLFKKTNGGNLFNGGEFQPLPKGPAELLNKASSLFNECGLRLGAADLVLTSEGVYLLDLNCYPGFKSLGPVSPEAVRLFRSF